MIYEIVQRVGTIEYTVRGPDHLAVAELLRRARALVEDVSEADTAFGAVEIRKVSLSPGSEFALLYQRQFRQVMDDLNAAINLVQANQSFFGGQPGADAVKIIGDFFCCWATEKLASGNAERQALAHQFVGTLPNSKPATPGSAEDHEAWGVFLTSRARALHHFHALGQSFDEIARTLNFADGEHVSCVFEATRHMAPNPWVPDDSGAWVEVASDFDPKAFFPRGTRIEFLLADERKQRHYAHDTSARADQLDSNANRARVRSPLIVAYKVVSP